MLREKGMGMVRKRGCCVRDGEREDGGGGEESSGAEAKRYKARSPVPSYHHLCSYWELSTGSIRDYDSS